MCDHSTLIRRAIASRIFRLFRGRHFDKCETAPLPIVEIKN
jgi:hypothetical protein